VECRYGAGAVARHIKECMPGVRVVMSGDNDATDDWWRKNVDRFKSCEESLKGLFDVIFNSEYSLRDGITRTAERKPGDSLLEELSKDVDVLHQTVEKFKKEGMRGDPELLVRLESAFSGCCQSLKYCVEGETRPGASEARKIGLIMRVNRFLNDVEQKRKAKGSWVKINPCPIMSRFP
jgi:hypothetical protein